MKIRIIGGGPAGLCFAALMKRDDPAHDIAIYERGPVKQLGVSASSSPTEHWNSCAPMTMPYIGCFRRIWKPGPT